MRATRSHAPLRRTAAAISAIAVALVLAAPAGAAVTLGQLAPSTPSPDCSGTRDYLQPSITGGNLYIARQAGTITSWSTRSANAGATYVFKVFRRTSDPDVFQVIAHATPRVLTAGVNVVPVNIKVRAGDMIGLNESGPDNSCTFPQPGDGVLFRGGTLADGSSGQFAPLNDVRMNLSAVLVPSNDFGIAAITRDRKQGNATVLLNVSNPGTLAISAKGMKKRATKNIAVAGTAQFNIAAAPSKRGRLEKRGKLTLTPTMTFSPSGGEPASFSFRIKLLFKKRRPQTVVLAHPRLPPA